MAQRQVIPLAEGTRRKRSAEEELLENEVLGFEDDDEDEEDEEDEEEGDFEDECVLFVGCYDCRCYCLMWLE